MLNFYGMVDLCTDKISDIKYFLWDVYLITAIINKTYKKYILSFISATSTLYTLIFSSGVEHIMMY